MFQVDFTTDMLTNVVGSGDSFDVKPFIYNDATEKMYVLIKIGMPITVNGTLYSCDADNDWTLVEGGNDTVVYAYGDTEMTVVSPGESASALTSQMTMKSIFNEEYAAVDDINITITGYAIGIEDVATNSTDARNE